MENLYSIWFVPQPSLKEPLEEIVLGLSKEYNSPKFEPHMTLLSEVRGKETEIVEKTKRLAKEILPFESLSLSEVSISTTYYQCVFIRVKVNHKLMEANLLAKKIFKLDNDVFMPHISLVYGDFDMAAREEMVNKIKLPEQRSFRAESLTVVPITKDPSDWQHLADIPVGF